MISEFFDILPNQRFTRLGKLYRAFGVNFLKVVLMVATTVALCLMHGLLTVAVLRWLEPAGRITSDSSNQNKK